VIVRQSGMDIGHGELREFGDNLFGSPALKIVPHMDVPHSDARSGDARLAATDPRVCGDRTPFHDLARSRVHTRVRPSDRILVVMTSDSLPQAGRSPVAAVLYPARGFPSIEDWQDQPADKEV
jgi:hypothetical protein